LLVENFRKPKIWETAKICTCNYFPSISQRTFKSI